jgi:hypothetical protein
MVLQNFTVLVELVRLNNQNKNKINRNKQPRTLLQG